MDNIRENKEQLLREVTLKALRSNEKFREEFIDFMSSNYCQSNTFGFVRERLCDEYDNHCPTCWKSSAETFLGHQNNEAVYHAISRRLLQRMSGAGGHAKFIVALAGFFGVGHNYCDLAIVEGEVVKKLLEVIFRGKCRE